MATRSVTATASVKAAAAQAEAESNIKLNEAKAGQKDLYKRLRDGEKTDVSISPMYQPYFGDNMCVSICGYPIYVPCDGQKYSVPKPYADIITENIARCDDSIRAAHQMSNVQNNFESYAGERQLIRRV